MTDIIIQKKNEIYLKIEAEPHIHQELSEYFTFEVPGAKFMPQYRSKHWDGKIRLYSNHNGEIYVGLLDKIVSWAKKAEYNIEFKYNKFYGDPFEENEMISHEGVTDYMKSISRHEPRDYQINAVYDALKYNRKLLVSPTASGKSLMIYSIVRYFTERDKKILLVVPTTSLVEQMYKDFEDYSWNAEDYCHKIYSGKEKTTDKNVIITTWQSIYNLNRKFFEDFDVVIGDEAHQFKSKSLVGIMTKLDNTKYRYGFTGTLDGSQTHKWVLEGLFGPSYKVTQTKDLIEKGHLSKLDIKVLLLKHDGCAHCQSRVETSSMPWRLVAENRRTSPPPACSFMMDSALVCSARVSLSALVSTTRNFRPSSTLGRITSSKISSSSVKPKRGSHIKTTPLRLSRVIK